MYFHSRTKHKYREVINVCCNQSFQKIGRGLNLCTSDNLHTKFELLFSNDATETKGDVPSGTEYREYHYHKENKTNRGKQIEFSAESNQFEKKIKSGNK